MSLINIVHVHAGRNLDQKWNMAKIIALQKIEFYSILKIASKQYLDSYNK